MDISDIEKTTYPGSHTLAFLIRTENITHNIWLESTHPIVSSLDCGNVMICATLLPAMKINEAISLTTGVDSDLVNNINIIQDIYKTWDPRLHKTVIHADKLAGNNPETRGGTGLMFSGGVDSFYTLVEKQDEISHLVYVYGFDIKLEDDQRCKKTASSLAKIATELNVELIEIKTNLRDFSDKYSPWGSHYHGAALAMIGHLLAPTLNKIYISSDFTYSQLHPWGSHILTAPLWNGKTSNQIFFGMNNSRFNKCKAISSHPLARQHLRVCWKYENSNTNCGQCEKCIRTMTSLHILGSLKHFSCFANGFSSEMIRNIRITSQASLIFTKDNLQNAIYYEASCEVVNALSFIIKNYELYEILADKQDNKNIVRLFCDDDNIRDAIFFELSVFHFPWLLRKVITQTWRKLLDKISSFLS